MSGLDEIGSSDFEAEHAAFAFDDASYVLGALNDGERAAFENHLLTCPLCQDSVAELSELPAMLALTDLATLELEPPPDTLLPRLMRSIGASRRYRAWRTAALGFAAACVLGVLVFVGATQWNHSQRPRALAMQAVGANAGDVHATVTLSGSGKGTRINLDCGYHLGAPTPTGYEPSYRMVVFNRLGQMRDLGSWTPQPGEDVMISRESPWSKQNISRIEVSDTSGDTLLTLSLT